VKQGRIRGIMEYKMIMSQDGTKLVNIHYIQSIVIDDNLGFCALVAVMEKRGNEIELAKYDSNSDAKMVFDELAAFFADEYSQFARNTVFAMPGQLTVSEMNSSVRKSYEKVCKSSKNIADNVFKDDAGSNPACSIRGGL